MLTKSKENNMAAEFNINDLIAEVTSGADTTTNVTIASGEISESKSKSGK